MKYKVIINKINKGQLNGWDCGSSKYVGVGSTVDIAIRKAKKVAEKDGTPLLSGYINIYKELESYSLEDEWKYIQTILL